jgi:hypothetical protein
MSNEINGEHGKSQSATTRKRFKITVACIALLMGAVAYATKAYLGDSRLAAVQIANLTFLAIVISGFVLDLIIFRSK